MKNADLGKVKVIASDLSGSDRAGKTPVHKTKVLF